VLHILICEDNPAQRARIEKIVNQHLLSDDFDMELALSADNPATLLEHLETHRDQSGLYFLDVNLQSDINGIELAAKIKKIDVSATIVFITTHSEMMQHVFRLKVEAMEYILKDSQPEEIEQRVAACMSTAYQRFLAGKHAKNKYFTAKFGAQKLNILYDDILFFESSAECRNKILLYKRNSVLEYYGTITGVSNLGPPFCRCHQSFVVNINHVKCVDAFNCKKAEMTDGTMIPIARRKMAEFLKCIG